MIFSDEDIDAYTEYLATMVKLKNDFAIFDRFWYDKDPLGKIRVNECYEFNIPQCSDDVKYISRDMYFHKLWTNIKIMDLSTFMKYDRKWAWH